MRAQGEGGVDRIVHDRFFAAAAAAGGVLVDVGAAGPDFLSIGALYRERGWRVIAIEPNPVFCDAHRAAGHEILQYACGERDADAVDFQVVDSHGETYAGGAVSFEAFSSLAVKPAYRALRADLDTRTIKVDVRRLDTILADHAPELEHVDVVSIDVEGWELEVLAGLDLDRYAPAVVIVENLFGERSYRRAMAGRGYLLWRRVAPNDIYVARWRLPDLERVTARLRASLGHGVDAVLHFATRHG
jgi:FkbM family methyltransferase